MRTVVLFTSLASYENGRFSFYADGETAVFDDRLAMRLLQTGQASYVYEEEPVQETTCDNEDYQKSDGPTDMTAIEVKQPKGKKKPKAAKEKG